jgi:hypothetical protein
MGTILFLIVAALALGFIVVLTIAGIWKVFEKAGKPGWAALIPFYNGWTLAEIGDMSGWWGLVVGLSIIRYDDLNAANRTLENLVFLFTIIGIAIYFKISINVAKNFNQSNLFGVFLALIPIVGYPILAFGPSPYKQTRNRKRKRLSHG